MSNNFSRNKKIKEWVVLSALVGLLPCILRLIFLASEEYRAIFDPIYILGDSILFGLILNIVNMHHVDNINLYKEVDIRIFKVLSGILIALLVAVNIGFMLREILNFSIIALIIFSCMLNFGTIYITIRHFNLESFEEKLHA